MGCDGGTIPKRDELVQTKKRPEQKDKDSVRGFRWQHCFLSQQRLAKPIVACELGHLYNKEAIIEKLLDDRSNGTASNRIVVGHIRSLKDVKELILEDNPAYDNSKAAGPSVGDGGYVDRLTAPFVCPVTGLEMNGKFKFVLDWSSGKVMSERACKMLKDDLASRIPEADLVVLNPEADSPEFDLMSTRMEARRARAKAEKASKKAASKRKIMGTEDHQEEDPDRKKASAEEPDRRKVGKESAATSISQRPPHPSTSKPTSKTSTSSVQSDPSKSEVFKSLFSSHKSAANKVKGHWVTFDPRYN